MRESCRAFVSIRRIHRFVHTQAGASRAFERAFPWPNRDQPFGLDPQFRTMRGIIVAKKGTGYFDRKGHFFKSAQAATESDLAALMGQIGEGESLAPGIAHMLLERRAEIERLFAEHDAMMAEEEAGEGPKFVSLGAKVTKLPDREAS